MDAMYDGGPVEPDRFPRGELRLDLAQAYGRVVTATLDMFGAAAAHDDHWSDKAVATLRENEVEFQALVFWLTMIAMSPQRGEAGPLDARNTRHIRFADRTGLVTYELGEGPVPVWWPMLADMLDVAGADELENWPLIGRLRRLRRLDIAGFADETVTRSLLLTVAATAWRAYDQAYGPFPGGVAGAAAHLTRWLDSPDGRIQFLAGLRQAALRLMVDAEAAADRVGVPTKPYVSDVVQRLTVIVSSVMDTGDLVPLPAEETELVGDLLRVAAAIVAERLPVLGQITEWSLRADPDAAMMVYLLEDGPPADATPELAGSLRFLRLAQLAAYDDGPAFEAYAQGIQTDPDSAVYATYGGILCLAELSVTELQRLHAGQG